MVCAPLEQVVKNVATKKKATLNAILRNEEVIQDRAPVFLAFFGSIPPGIHVPSGRPTRFMGINEAESLLEIMEILHFWKGFGGYIRSVHTGIPHVCFSTPNDIKVAG